MVDNAVVTASLYKLGSRVVHDSKSIDSLMFEYARSIVDIWAPAEAFCLDVAQISTGEYKVVEINCINSAGFYDANIPLLYGALSSL
jgi:hypothetical protein